MDVDFSADAQTELDEFLVARFGVQLPLEYRPVTAGKGSRGTHYLATDPDGIRVGLKYVSAHFSDPQTKQHLLPTENIVAAAELSRTLSTPSVIDAEMVGPIKGLGALDGHRFAARRWHGGPIAGLRQERVDGLRLRLHEQCGEWVAFGLLFALADGKVQHWTWDEEAETIGRCDLELLFFEHGKVGDYVSLMRAVGAERAVKSGEGEPFNRGVRAMVRRFRERRAAVDAVMEGIDDHTAGFLASHGWAQLSEDEFVESISAKL